MLPSKIDLITLRELPGVGERTVTRLVALVRRRGQSLRSVLAASPQRLEREFRLPAIAIDRLHRQGERHLERCRWIESELRRAGATLWSSGEVGFPERLRRNLRDPPPMLYALGSAAILRRPCAAILSSREIEDGTLAAIVAATRCAAGHGFAAAIGGMKSTHRLAALAARAAAGHRIVVLDRGLFASFGSDFRTDPFGCGPDKTALDRRTTLVLSSFRPEDHAAPDSGRRRDEIIAALGDFVFAASARPGGEVERICTHALSIGVPVVVWHDVLNPALRDAGATVVDAAALDATFRRFQALPRKEVPREDRPPHRQPRRRAARKPRSPVE